MQFVNEYPVNETSKPGRLAYLDGWRGLAIGFVLLDHFFPVSFVDSGRIGVDVFFVLSGLLMSRILFVQRMSLSLFYKRRISRIFPVFLLYLLLVYAVAFCFGRAESLIELASMLAFLRTYVPATPDIWQAALPVGHLWSLNVEEHCYVFMSVLALFVMARRREGIALIGFGMAAIVMYVVYYKSPSPNIPVADIRTETAAAPLLLSAGYFLVKDRFAPYVRPWMPVAAFGAALFCYSVLLPGWTRMLIASFLLAFSVCHLDDVPRFIRSLLSVKPLRMLGIWSYSIYLWQQPFYTYKSSYPTGLAFFGAMLAGIGSFYLVENPVRSWLNKKW